MTTETRRKIVINTSYETFCVSHAAFLRLRELGQKDALKEEDLGAYWPQAASPQEPSLNRCGQGIPRDDQRLVQVVEELGVQANGHAASLRVVEIPSDVAWEIEKVGGREQVSETHRTWR
ncbi:MAG: hypothetical protein KGO52_05525 [Nitrospirota bacterium]|jgi:hypothetical protein|nr:hypothetical protein [Nitrospirota bacterium]MDE3119461.1 hypothetical protein [Nitrospirota bacterium]MDE3224205.1 hypothetical protein [Nitrospirota bacterium]MDE3242163.1 hypothetical protein [Nitrospirota bacterium]